MMSLIHALQAYIIAAVISKNSRLRMIAFLGGLFPDLDGITYLFNRELYYRYHHEIFHLPLAGIVTAALLIFWLYERKSAERRGSWAFFLLGFFIHTIGDLFTTSWPINILAPLGALYVSASPALPDSLIYGTIAPALTILTILLFAVLAFARRL